MKGVEAEEVVLGFNPRPRTRGRPWLQWFCNWTTAVSIHAPVQGGDAMWSVMLSKARMFQSTPPYKGATLFT